MAGGHYGDLKKKFGFIQIEFDQNDMVWPAFAVKMEQGVFGTFAPAGEGDRAGCGSASRTDDGQLPPAG